MGLTNWKHAPEGKILKSDVSIAKNYLSLNCPVPLLPLLPPGNSLDGFDEEAVS
jgi:hypothetical protein